MLPRNYTYRKLGKLAFLTTLAILSIISIAHAIPFRKSSSPPKFFTCPQGMTRFVALATTKHDLNLCGKSDGDMTLIAVRIHRTRRIVTMPILSSKEHVYIAKSPKGTYLYLDTRKNTLTIKKKNGKVAQEKIEASDAKF